LENGKVKWELIGGLLSEKKYISIGQICRGFLKIFFFPSFQKKVASKFENQT
jgi:hypothetical protein